MDLNSLAATSFFNLIFLPVLFLTNSNSCDDSQVVLIQGQPCRQLFENDTMKILTKKDNTWSAYECDQLCEKTSDCDSFAWQRDDSSCRLVSHKPRDMSMSMCYEPNSNIFWFARGGIQLLRDPIASSGIKYVALSQANGYAQPANVWSAPPIREITECQVSSGRLSLDAAETYCDEFEGFESFSPRSFAEIELLLRCRETRPISFLTAYKGCFSFPLSLILA